MGRKPEATIVEHVSANFLGIIIPSRRGCVLLGNSGGVVQIGSYDAYEVGRWLVDNFGPVQWINTKPEEYKEGDIRHGGSSQST